MDDDTIRHEIFAIFAEHLVPEAFATPTRASATTRGFHRLLHRHPAHRLHPLRRR
jgi:hypothetical protein